MEEINVSERCDSFAFSAVEEENRKERGEVAKGAKKKISVNSAIPLRPLRLDKKMTLAKGEFKNG